MPPPASSGPPAPRQMRELVEVVFEYRATTTVDESILRDHRTCALIVGPAHIHASWRGFDLFRLTPEGEEVFRATFTDVPVGYRRIRVSDPNVCPMHPTGAVTGDHLYANGVLLTTQVDTPGTGVEPGYSFSVSADGIVTP